MRNFNRTTFLRRLGAWISKLRKSHGFGQDELTRQAGLSKGSLSRIENGVVDPQASTLVKLADAMDIPPARTLELPKTSGSRS